MKLSYDELKEINKIVLEQSKMSYIPNSQNYKYHQETVKNMLNPDLKDIEPIDLFECKDDFFAKAYHFWNITNPSIPMDKILTQTFYCHSKSQLKRINKLINETDDKNLMHFIIDEYDIPNDRSLCLKIFDKILIDTNYEDKYVKEYILFLYHKNDDYCDFINYVYFKEGDYKSKVFPRYFISVSATECEKILDNILILINNYYDNNKLKEYFPDIQWSIFYNSNWDMNPSYNERVKLLLNNNDNIVPACHDLIYSCTVLLDALMRILNRSNKVSKSNNSHSQKFYSYNKSDRIYTVNLGGVKYITENRKSISTLEHRTISCSFSVRGHERHYKNGKVVFVKPFIKGKGKPFKEKSYKAKEEK